MNMKQIVSVILISIVTSGATVWSYNKFTREESYVYPANANTNNNTQGKTPANYTGFDGVAGANKDRKSVV